MNAVGIDISKGKSMVAIMRPFGEVVASPFEVLHTDSELGQLANRLLSLNGETKVIMECTGSYHQPIAYALHEAGLHVSCVHAKLIHDFGNNTIRRVKTDKDRRYQNLQLRPNQLDGTALVHTRRGYTADA